MSALCVFDLPIVSIRGKRGRGRGRREEGFCLVGIVFLKSTLIQYTASHLMR
jgi:hypothetical protein